MMKSAELRAQTQPDGSYLVTADTDGLHIRIEVDPKLWNPQSLSVFVAHVAEAIRTNGKPEVLPPGYKPEVKQ